MIFTASAEANNVMPHAVFAVFPGEFPTRSALEAWIKSWIADMNTAGFGCFTRGELPHDVAKLVPKTLLPVPTDVALQPAIAVKNVDIEHYNKITKIERDAKVLELKNRLASRLAKSMETTAQLRLLALQKKHSVKKADGSVIPYSFDGEGMWLDVVKLLDETETDKDVKKYIKQMESLRDTPMDDNCTSQQWSERMVAVNKCNLHVDVPYDGVRFSKLIVGMMPKNLATRRDVEVDKIKDKSKFDDPVEVLMRMTKIIEDSYDEEFSPTMTVAAHELTLAAVVTKTELMMKGAKTYAVNVANASNKQKESNEAPKSKKGGRKPMWTKQRPDGEKCSKGTCTFAHPDEVA